MYNKKEGTIHSLFLRHADMKLKPQYSSLFVFNNRESLLTIIYQNFYKVQTGRKV